MQKKNGEKVFIAIMCSTCLTYEIFWIFNWNIVYSKCRSNPLTLKQESISLFLLNAKVQTFKDELKINQFVAIFLYDDSKISSRSKIIPKSEAPPKQWI